MSFLLSYIDEIESGRIIAGQELKSVLNGLKRDLDNPRYIYDERPGQIRIEFIERFCKHTKSPFNGQPFLLELCGRCRMPTPLQRFSARHTR